jgi:uncharacterized protein
VIDVSLPPRPQRHCAVPVSSPDEQVPVTRPSPRPERLVLDTNVWLDLLHFADPGCARLHAALHSGEAIALVDPACRAEWQRVLGYPGLGLAAADVTRLCAAFDAIAQPLGAALRPPPWPGLPRCRDRDDQKFLELACAGAADRLLSRDSEVLRLARRTERLGLFRICRPDAY